MATPQRPSLPPYLGPNALSFLVIASPIVITLALTAIRLILSLTNLNSSADSAKSSLANACAALEQTASVAVSMPHFMADNVNEMTAGAAQGIVNGLAEVLDLSIVGIEALVLFIVDTYRSMYLCLAQLVVRGSLALAIDATQEANDFIRSTFQSAKSDIQTVFQGAETALDKSIGVINRIPGVNIDPPSISIPNLSALDNVQLPATLTNALTSLNSSLPTLEELKEKLNAIIATPFESLRAEVNSTLGSVNISSDIFPVPERSTVGFCDDLDTSFIDRIAEDIAQAAKIGLLILLLVGLLAIVALALFQHWRYRRYLQSIQWAREAWLIEINNSATPYHLPTSHAARNVQIEQTLSTHSLLSFLQASNHPLIHRILQKIYSKTPGLRKSPRRRANATWFFAFITHKSALLALGIGLLGLLSVELQLAAVKPIRGRAQNEADQGLANLQQDVKSRINDIMRDTSYSYSNNSNAVIRGVESGINNKMFGWVNVTTTTLNTTIVTFYDGLTDAITKTFSGTPLNNAALEVVNCIIGTKVEAISKGLTFVHDHAHVSLPTVSPNVLMLSPERMNDLTENINSDNQSSPTSSFIQKIVDNYIKALKKERIGYLLLIGLWFFIVLCGILAIIWHEHGKPRWDRRRKHNSALNDKSLYSEKQAFYEVKMATPSLSRMNSEESIKKNVSPYSFPQPATTAITGSSTSLFQRLFQKLRQRHASTRSEESHQPAGSRWSFASSQGPAYPAPPVIKVSNVERTPTYTPNPFSRPESTTNPFATPFDHPTEK